MRGGTRARGSFQPAEHRHRGVALEVASARRRSPRGSRPLLRQAEHVRRERGAHDVRRRREDQRVKTRGDVVDGRHGPGGGRPVPHAREAPARVQRLAPPGELSSIHEVNVLNFI